MLHFCIYLRSSRNEPVEFRRVQCYHNASPRTVSHVVRCHSAKYDSDELRLEVATYDEARGWAEICRGFCRDHASRQRFGRCEYVKLC
jgi:hypothetical protein